MALAGPQIGGVSLLVHIVIIFIAKLISVITRSFAFLGTAAKYVLTKH